MSHKDVIKELIKLKNPKKVAILSSFFKTKKGQYGYGDIFWGINIPTQRVIAKNNIELKLSEVQKLLNHKVHEVRMTGILILVYKFKKADEKLKSSINKFYLKNSKKINNWDLVDVSVRDIIGEYLLKKDRKILYKLAKSKNLWERRMSIVATWAFIRQRELEDTYKLALELMNDSHDLIHKAVGWMLREAGKRDEKRLIEFLKEYKNKMPRVMYSYAKERISVLQ